MEQNYILYVTEENAVPTFYCNPVFTYWISANKINYWSHIFLSWSAWLGGMGWKVTYFFTASNFWTTACHMAEMSTFLGPIDCAIDSQQPQGTCLLLETAEGRRGSWTWLCLQSVSRLGWIRSAFRSQRNLVMLVSVAVSIFCSHISRERISTGLAAGRINQLQHGVCKQNT